MNRIMDELPRLAIDKGSPIGSPDLQQDDDQTRLAASGIYNTPKRAGLERSDTSDSLHHLVGRSPNLTHLQGLTPLPSPIVSSEEPKGEQRQRNHAHTAAVTCSSPLQMYYSAGDTSESSERVTNNVQQAKPQGLLPAKLFARLQKEHRSSRATSLNVSQNLDKMEMPRITRHRSQTAIEQTNDAMHREDQNGDSQHRSRPGVDRKHTIFAPEQEVDLFQVYCLDRWRTFVAINELGQGAFSRVMLAHDQDDPDELVAVKIVDLVHSGGADHARVEQTVRREIELLEKVNSPLLISLHGYYLTGDRALLVLDYLPGGDLFTLTAEHKTALTVPVVRRLFAELVCAVRTLHNHNIVHRDLKLENILLRYGPDVMRKPSAYFNLWTTLTDLGLARSFDPDGPDLTTRCGSEDYAAPEIIMGQTYDGRQTDAWALGVLLYTLMEGRLPFDVIPGLEHKMQSRVLHRICRIEWRWVRMKEKGTFDAEWEGAKKIVSNLLRSRTKRWSLDMVVEDAWLSEDVSAVEALMKH